MSGIIGKKIGMTSLFNEEGKNIPCTVIQAGPCAVLQVRTEEVDGYTAVQLGFDDKSEKNVSKALAGHFKKAGSTPKAKIVEFRNEFEHEVKVGDQIIVDMFNEGEYVDVTGTSKGKGFQGVMRRHHFKGFPGSHGTHEYFRHGGSIGCRKFPGRVFKGRKMPGHMGARQVTTQNLEIVGVRPDDNVILIKGAVPGAENSYLSVQPAVKA